MLQNETKMVPQSLQAVYVGPNMDVFLFNYESAHQKFDHATHYAPTVADVAKLELIPDIAVINPMVETPNGVDGACALQAIVPESTVIVAIYTTLGPSHSMYARHALGGRCHPRMLVHYPNIQLEALDIVATIDCMARNAANTSQIRTTGHLPPSLQPQCSRKDLGQVMTENFNAARSDDSLTFARLLHKAATNRHWSTWGELASTLGFGEGHVKNTKAKIGRVLTNEVLPNETDLGVPPPDTHIWRIAPFTRFITEHQSFIRAYCSNHLDCSF